MLYINQYSWRRLQSTQSFTQSSSQVVVACGTTVHHLLSYSLLYSTLPAIFSILTFFKLFPSFS